VQYSAIFSLAQFTYSEGTIMKRNIGSVDRTIRIVAGLVLIAAVLLGLIGPWGWIGVIPLATGIFRFCPAYLPFGISTCGIKR
jgi:hypothetical protein